MAGKKHSRKVRRLVALLAVAGSGALTAQDLTIVSTVTSGKGKTTTSTQYITRDKIRTSDGRFDTIIDVATGRMVHVDHKKETFYETSFEEMRAHFAELEEMLRSNPMMSKMFGQATEVEVEKGSGSRTIAGYECVQYLMTLGEKLRFEFWVAPALKPPLEYYDARKMAYAAMGPTASRFEKMWEAMKEIDGLPLYTKIESRMMGINMLSEGEATEVKKGPIPAGAFEPPAGYKQKKNPYEGN